MFERLLALFEPYHTPVPNADPDHAFGALLVRVAKADDDYKFEELQRIDVILQRRLNIDPVVAAKFRAECEKLEAVIPDTEALSAVLVKNLDQATREDMVKSMWEVLMADGVRKRPEQDVVEQVANMFGLDGIKI